MSSERIGVQKLIRDDAPNFLALMKLMANHDPILRAHLDSPILKNATYMSPKIQNEVINIMGEDMILAQIVSEVTGEFTIVC